MHFSFSRTAVNNTPAHSNRYLNLSWSDSDTLLELNFLNDSGDSEETRLLPLAAVACHTGRVKFSFFAADPDEGEAEKDASISARRPQQEEANVNPEVEWDCSTATTEEESKALIIRVKITYST